MEPSIDQHFESAAPDAKRPQNSAMTTEEANRRQAAYAASRRDWAERVGRPYDEEPDPRPPPGELDAEADE
jgi:hypothetical protein